ncbi:MAG: ferritin-like domain-containing protein [Comamonadaceae bacterium]|nr:ferritin-like domain-containing protein [Comamonadaceae bacterium]
MSAVMDSYRSILDQPESRFPLELGTRNPKIRKLFHASLTSQWNPVTVIDWDAIDPAAYTPEQRMALRTRWSRRAWGEYGAISESPALQVRFCHDAVDPDARLYFSIRSQEESRHAEISYLLAEKFGGYIDAPAADYENSVSTHGVRRLALDLDVPVECTVAALVCAAEQVIFNLFKHVAEITTQPAIRKTYQLILRDEARHCAFGWYFVASRLPGLGAQGRRRIRDAVAKMVQEVELNGYQIAWLAPESEASRAQIESDRILWEAGLGASVEELEKPVFVSSLRDIRGRMKREWDIELPVFHHPKTGDI